MNITSIENRLNSIISAIYCFIKGKTTIGNYYWSNRAERFGVRSVLNLGHLEGNISDVTNRQKEIIFPILKNILSGKERLILDFGCGPGRFTCALAVLIHGKAIGIDPTKKLLELAPKNDNVEYRLMKSSGNFPIESKSIDVIWICLVLGGIVKNKHLFKSIKEIDRVLKDGGKIILIEDTTATKSSKHWKSRPIEYYENIFDKYHLCHVKDYEDLNENISIFTGRKVPV